MAKVVFISSCGAFDRLVLQRAAEVCDVALVWRVTWAASRSGKQPAGSRFSWDRVARSLERTAFFARQERRLEANLARALGVEDLNLPANIRDIPQQQVNSLETIDELQRIAPDFVVTSAAPLLKPALFGVPRHGCVNVHRGIASAYRGDHTLFWALYHRDYANLGVTLHYIDAGVDTGRVLAQETLSCDGADDELSLTVKAARAAGDLLAEFLSSGPPWAAGHATSVRGRLFRERDRRFWHDARCWLQSRWSPAITRSGEVEKYFPEG